MFSTVPVFTEACILGGRSLKVLPFALLASAAVVSATGCEPDASCAETATCPPNGSDNDPDAGRDARDGSLDRTNAGDGPGTTIDTKIDTERDDIGPGPADGRTTTDARVDSAGDDAARDVSGGDRDVSADTKVADVPSVDVPNVDVASVDVASVDASVADSADGGSVTVDAPRADTSSADTSSDDARDAGSTVDAVDAVIACGASTCPTGCCDANNKCVPAPTNDACGTGGATCQACGAGQQCNGTSCVCTSSSCTSGCCSGNQCVPFANQSDNQCGAASVCASCAAMQKCDKSNGQCVCNSDSCPTGCCDSTKHCVPYADQSDMTCGAGGAACNACTSDKYCTASGGCDVKTWCRGQTIPAGIDLSDYQCVDFDKGALPSGWTLTQAAGGTGVISTTQASSVPASFYSTSFVDAETVGTLYWSHVGATAITSVDFAVDVFRVTTGGDPGPWTGYNDLLCTGIGNTRACLYYQGAAGFGVAYWSGTNRVDCGPIMELKMGVWTRIELQISSNGAIYLWADGATRTACNTSGNSFPSSTNGSAAVGIARTGMTTGGEMYFDNLVAEVRR